MKNNSKYSKERIEEAVANNKSVAGAQRYLGLSPKAGGRYPWQKKLINQYEIDTSHFTGQGWNKGSICYKTNDVFAEGSTASREKVRRFIIRDNLIPYECAGCGNKGIWMGKEMSQELDHINGVPNDHRLDNLQFLCPNCHAITATYCGRNKRARESEN